MADAVRFIVRRQNELEERVKKLESLEGINIGTDNIELSAKLLKGVGI